MDKHGSIRPGDTPDLSRDRAPAGCRPAALCKSARPAPRPADELDKQDLAGRLLARGAASPSRDS